LHFYLDGPIVKPVRPPPPLNNDNNNEGDDDDDDAGLYDDDPNDQPHLYQKAPRKTTSPQRARLATNTPPIKHDRANQLHQQRGLPPDPVVAVSPVRLSLRLGNNLIVLISIETASGHRCSSR
jgi:hypothetical protein